MDKKVVDLYDEYIHGFMDRRECIKRLSFLAGSAIAANALLVLLENNDAKADFVSKENPRLDSEETGYRGKTGEIRAKPAQPKGDGYMIKFVFCAKRHPSMSRAEFQDYWLNQHGPLFKKFADTYRAVRYVQSHTIDSPLNENIRKSRGTSEAFDGVGEIWWQSEKDFLAAINSPEGQKLRVMFVEDEAKFINLSASSVFFTVEHVLIDGNVS